MTLLRMAASDKENANVRSTRHCPVAALLTFVSASWGFLMSVYILKGRFGDGEEAPVNYKMQRAEARTPRTWSPFFWNNSGSLDAVVFKAVLARVAEELSTRDPGMRAVIFRDQRAENRRADAVECAMKLKLFLFCLAPNSYRNTQPLDEAPFGAMQAGKNHRDEVYLMDAEMTNTCSQDTLLLAAYAAERQEFTRTVIQRSLPRRGLCASSTRA